MVVELADKPEAGKADLALVRTVDSLGTAAAGVAAGNQDGEGNQAAEVDIQDTLVAVEDSRAVEAGKLVVEPVGEQPERTRSELVQLVVQKRSQTLQELFACPLRIAVRLLPAISAKLLLLKNMLDQLLK